MTSLNLAARLNSRPLIMGVINCTPDSFSDGGNFSESRRAIAQAETLSAEGADIIDIGGEATGPGSKPVSDELEIKRIIDVIKAVASKITVSVDTYKAKTAGACLELGAQMVNDVSALRADPALAGVVREHGCYVVLMHSKETGISPHASEDPKAYKDIVRDVGDFLAKRIDFALAQGIKAERIIVDPGMGKFVSTEASASWELVLRLGELAQRFAQFPILLGTSRKGFLGGTVNDRETISQLTGMWGITQGAKIVRTHNVAMIKRLLSIWSQLTN